MKDYDVLVVGERAAVMVDQQSPAARRRSRTRLVVQVVLSLMLVVAIVYFMVNATGLAQAAIRSHNFARYGRRRVAKTQSRTAVSPPSLTRTCSDRGVHVGLTAAMEYDNEEHITWGSTIADELRKRRSAGRAPWHGWRSSWGWSPTQGQEPACA